MARRGPVSLGRDCDNACVFCAQEGLGREAIPIGEVRRRLEELRAAGADAVTFVGGEPAIDPKLEGLVAQARTLGFRAVGVQTNGWALAEPGRVEALARSGLTDVHLSIHGGEARVHDWHAGRVGAFDAALRTLGASRAAGLPVVVLTLLTRSTFRVLAAIPRLLASRGVAGWCVEFPRWRGSAARGSDRVVPRLSLALPFALHAIDAADALGLPAFVRGAPSCLLGPWAARAIDDATREYGAACVACASQPSCAGVDALYLGRFGDGELAGCAPVRRDSRHEDIRAMFVGVGEMAPASNTATVTPSPERARVTLPLLGRPAPGKSEVTASVPRKTGEALRAILPTLFDPEPTRKP